MAEAENRIGEQFELFADRASSATMMANQLRMQVLGDGLSVLVDTLRRVGHALYSVRRCLGAASIRLKLLKLGAQVRYSSVRRIRFAASWPRDGPNKIEFELAHIYLQRAFSSAWQVRPTSDNPDTDALATTHAFSLPAWRGKT